MHSIKDKVYRSLSIARITTASQCMKYARKGIHSSILGSLGSALSRTQRVIERELSHKIRKK